MKKCARCGIEKSIDSFKDVRRKSGSKTKYSYCKSCEKQYAVDNAHRILNNAYREMDRKKGLEFNITDEFTKDMIFKPCVYCGGFSDSGYNGLDRVNNDIGHTVENCVTACKECNNARNRYFSFEEMMVIGSAIASVRKSREKQ